MNDTPDDKQEAVPHRSLARSVQSAITTHNVHRLVLTLVVAAGAGIAVIALALTGYAAFYWMVLPEVRRVDPIWLEYTNAIRPTGYVDLTQQGRYPKPLASRQTYTVSVDFEMPLSDRNLDLGNFMLVVDMLTANNVTVARSSRPCLLPYHSPVKRLIKSLMRIPLYLLGFPDEKFTMSMLMLENFRESDAHPVTQAMVAISERGLQIYKASLRLDAEFQGLRYFMYYWPISTATVFVGIFIFWESIVALITWRIYGQRAMARLRAYAEPQEGVDSQELQTASLEYPNSLSPAHPEEQPWRYPSPAANLHDETDSVTSLSTSSPYEHAFGMKLTSITKTWDQPGSKYPSTSSAHQPASNDKKFASRTPSMQSLTSFNTGSAMDESHLARPGKPRADEEEISFDSESRTITDASESPYSETDEDEVRRALSSGVDMLSKPYYYRLPDSEKPSMRSRRRNE